ncbi:MAG TPA: hypothetical protein VNJ07_02035 [Chitinophagales bacterium]|nr:hypothetical protein [Chitinophagales bacterium]
MKIDITHEEYINMTLFEAKFPFFYSHSVMTVFADYRYDSIPDYKNKFLSFERYSGGADKMRFRNLVLHGMGDDPIGYYKTPLINDFISKQKEAQCYADYYAQLYDGRHRDKIAFIMKKAGDDVGVFVFELQGKDTINTSMAAVLPAYRSSGLFHDMKVFRQRFCVESGITKAYAGFRLNNFNTPNSLLKIGYKIVMGEHVFHIAPLLNKQKSPSSY